MDKVYPLVASKGFSVAHNIAAPDANPAVSMQQWMRPRALTRRPRREVDKNQATSLSAMISYVSSRSGKSEFGIERSLADHFNVPNAKCLPANDFDKAIRYLADILPE